MSQRKNQEPTTPGTSSTHLQDVKQYVDDVLSGKQIACKWVKLACLRHQQDLAAAEAEGYPYFFDETHANHAIKFIELLPHVSGKWAAKKQLLRLEPWQKFIVASLFGWLKHSNGKRRFRIAYCCIPRKNAKSTLAAAIGLYCLVMDGEYGGQVFAGATGEKQAHLVFDPAKEMVKRTPKLIERYGVEVNAKSIVVADTNSRFEPLIGKPGDGGSPSLAIVDEYHEHPDPTLYDTMVTGFGAREQPLALVITTAGVDIAGPCHAMQRDMEKTLEGALDNPDWFAIIFTIDSEAYVDHSGQRVEADDWTTLSALQKANPNWGVSVMEENILAEQRVAIQTPEKQNIFKTKHLNIWCSARAAWMNMERWKACADTSLKIQQFKGQSCVMGFDLGAQIDITARILLFRKMITGVEHFYCFPYFYLPEERALAPNCEHYQAWVHKKLLHATPGNETDFKLIKNHVLSEAKEYQVLSFAFDKWQALNFKQQLAEEAKFETAEIPQNAVTFTEPMRWLEAMVLAGRFHHNGDPIMNWMISNVQVREDANEMIFPRKEKPENKIDGVTALLNALVVAQRSFDAAPAKKFVFTGF